MAKVTDHTADPDLVKLVTAMERLCTGSKRCTGIPTGCT